MAISSYRDLMVWQQSFQTGIKIYKELKKFPKFEMFALCDQMRRSIVSIPSNIAEGHSRDSKKEFIHFLSISRGSLAELQTQLMFSIDLEYINKEIGENFIKELNGIDIMLCSLIKKLKCQI